MRHGAIIARGFSVSGGFAIVSIVLGDNSYVVLSHLSIDISAKDASGF